MDGLLRLVVGFHPVSPSRVGLDTSAGCSTAQGWRLPQIAGMGDP